MLAAVSIRYDTKVHRARKAKRILRYHQCLSQPIRADNLRFQTIFFRLDGPVNVQNLIPTLRPTTHQSLQQNEKELKSQWHLRDPKKPSAFAIERELLCFCLVPSLPRLQAEEPGNVQLTPVCVHQGMPKQQHMLFILIFYSLLQPLTTPAMAAMVVAS